MVSQAAQSLRVPPLSQEEETVHAEIVPDQRIDDRRRQFFTDIFFQEGRMTAGAVRLQRMKRFTPVNTNSEAIKP